ncbi:MAG: hypothetical protein U0840_29960 [Gemmataceae bacterium]
MRKQFRFFEWMAQHPLRPPAWRWERAQQLVAQQQRASRHRDDEPTCRAVRFLRRLERCNSEQERQKLAIAEPAMAAALRLHSQARPLLEVKARILARQTNRAIARSLAVTPEVIGCFRVLFFDVADRLEAPYYVANVVARVPLSGCVTPESLLLLAAYWHGPGVVDTWMEFLSQEGHTLDLSTVAGRNQQALELLLRVHQLSDSEQQRWQLVRKLPFIQSTGSQYLSPQRTVRSLFLDKLSRSLAIRLPEDHQTGRFPDHARIRKPSTAPRPESPVPGEWPEVA